MIFIYRFKTNKIPVVSSSVIETEILDGIEITFDIDGESILKEIAFTVKGIEISYTNDEAIITDIPSIKERVFKVCSYLANKALIESSSELGDPKNILMTSPEVLAETEEERAIFQKMPRRKIQSIPLSSIFTKSLDLTEYTVGYRKSEVYSTFSDALRVNDEFLQFQQLYKVIEHCFNGVGEKLDKKVSAFLLQYDSYFTQDVIKGLRDLRRRMVHPDARGGHIIREKYSVYIGEIREKYKVLHKACCILLEHAPLQK
jgi:hypothetical protein